jgi:uncharacterized protein
MCYGCHTSGGPSLSPQNDTRPIIDVHLHSADMTWITRTDTSWWPHKIARPASDTALMNETIRTLRANNVVRAIASGFGMPTTDRYRSAAPELIVPAEMFGGSGNVDSLRAHYKQGRIRALGEVLWQYDGISAADPAVDKFWALAEELDAPVGIHMGPGPPGEQFLGSYRSVLSDPLQLEPVLVKHPNLRVWVMHAGWPMGDRMIALLYAFPQVYIDISVIDWYIPRAEFHSYLKRLVDAGFGDRIMYGSDQMLWPGAIPVSISAINSAAFLSDTEKRNILCDNAARFFRFAEDICRLGARTNTR